MKLKGKFKWLLIVACVYSKSLFAQSIDKSRLASWSTLDLPKYNYSKFVNVTDYGLKGDSTIDNSVLLNNLIASNKGKSVIYYFSPGKYLFQNSINLADSALIKGAGADSTVFYFKPSTAVNLFEIKGSKSTTNDTVRLGYAKFSKHIETKYSTNLVKNKYIRIFENDGGRIFSSWGNLSIGQILKIDSINGKHIYFNKALRQTYRDSLTPRIEEIYPMVQVGFECFKLVRLDQTTSQTINFNFEYAANCWVSGVQSYYSNFAHIACTYSSSILVSNNYFKFGYNYGSGGKAYGTAIQFSTGDCFIANNVFDNLRHSMLLQAGCNGNVFAYNYSINSYRADFPTDFASDIALHGNYPYCNLFEGNCVNLIWIDDSHGKNGPFNTFLRNRAFKYGIVMSQNISDSLNFIGNEITGTGFGQGNYSLTGIGHYEYGNNKNGVILPTGTANITLKSFLYSAKPNFWNGSPFPNQGYPMFNQFVIPAATRISKNILSYCADKSPLDTTSTINVLNMNGLNEIKIFPNPAAVETTITVQLPKLDAEGGMVYDLGFDGREISRSNAQLGMQTLSLKFNNTGVFFVKLVSKSFVVTRKLAIQ